MAKKKAQRGKKAPADTETYTLHLLAGSTGDLLTRLATMATTQFPDAEFEIVSHPLQDDVEKLEATLDELSGKRKIVLHALADKKSKTLVRKRCVVLHIPHYDVTGPLLNFISDCVGALPRNDISRLFQFDATYQRRIEAMEFALEHDDSLGLRSLPEAEIVIVGVSRVSKSPTMLYLSSRGFKVANVSISPETGFPEELDKTSKKKIVAFTSKPKRLHEIRSERARRIGSAGTDYEDLKSVVREVMNAEEEYRKRGYPIIDVTTLTIEQTAARILEELKLQPR